MQRGHGRHGHGGAASPPDVLKDTHTRVRAHTHTRARKLGRHQKGCKGRSARHTGSIEHVLVLTSFEPSGIGPASTLAHAALERSTGVGAAPAIRPNRVGAHDPDPPPGWRHSSSIRSSIPITPATTALRFTRMLSMASPLQDSSRNLRETGHQTLVKVHLSGHRVAAPGTIMQRQGNGADPS